MKKVTKEHTQEQAKILKPRPSPRPYNQFLFSEVLTKPNNITLNQTILILSKD